MKGFTNITPAQIVDTLSRHRPILMAVPDVSYITVGNGCIVVHAIHRRNKQLRLPATVEGIPVTIQYIASGDEPIYNPFPSGDGEVKG
jgi:hypothetical protein